MCTQFRKERKALSGSRSHMTVVIIVGEENGMEEYTDLVGKLCSPREP